ncbi:MAG: hypothetical protein KF768_05295 [Phycisphaeraceae bacterium]|nr:hypothetical protein [Phycisphaeraceae bacterium]
MPLPALLAAAAVVGVGLAGAGFAGGGLSARSSGTRAELGQASPVRSVASAQSAVAMTILDHELRATPVLVTAVELRPDGRGEVRVLESAGGARERRIGFHEIAALGPEGFWSARGDDHRHEARLRPSPGRAVPARPIDEPPRGPLEELGIEPVGPAVVRADARAGWIELTDGQVLAGALARADASGERVAWTASRLLGHAEAGRAIVDRRVGAALRADDPDLIDGAGSVSFGFSIDRIRRIVAWSESFAERPLSTDDGVSDLVLLRNGDLLRGFVEGIASDAAPPGGEAGEEVVRGSRARITIESAGRVVQVPYESVAQVVLQSPATPVAAGPSRPVARVVLADGTSLLVGSISTLHASAGGQPVPARLKLSVPALRSASIAEEAGEPASVTVDAADVRSIVPIATRLTPLSSLAIVRHEPASDRRRADAPVRPVLSPRESSGTLGAAPIGLDGPCVVEWALSMDADAASAMGAGAERPVWFAGRVSLPSVAAPWGDCDVRLEWLGEGSAGPMVLGSARLNGDMPSVRLAGPVPVGSAGSASGPGVGGVGGIGGGGARLRLTVEAGAYGPIRDAVVLDEWLLLERAGQP